MGGRIRVGVYGLNLRLASLVLATIGKLWFWWLGALTGSVYTSSGFIENRSVLDVMSRWKYHFRHMEMMITQDTELVLYKRLQPSGQYDQVRIVRFKETSCLMSDICFVRGRHISSPRPNM